MTKKELLAALEKYDDENEIEFFDRENDTFLELQTVEESVGDWNLRLNFDHQ